MPTEFALNTKLRTGTESLYRMLKRFEDDGSMKKRPGSGRPRTIPTEENEVVEDLICSQEDTPGSHLSP